MSRLVKHFAPIAALTLATLGSAWLFSNTSSSNSRLTQTSPPEKKASRAPARTPASHQRSSSLELRYLPKEGRRYVYSFQRRIVIQGLPNKSSAPSEITYHGQLEMDVIKSGPHGFEALTRAHLAEHSAKSPVALKIQLSSAGDRLEIFGAPLRSEDERQQSAILKDLLSLWGFNLREDTVGAFDARFETHPLRKTKLSYTESKTQSAPLPEIVDSEHFLGWDEYRSLPHEVSGHETTRMSAGQINSAQAALSARSDYQILLVKEEALPAQAALLASQLKDSETLALDAIARTEDRNELDWAALRSALQGLDSLDSSSRLKLFGDLVRYVKAHAGSAEDLLDLLRTQGAIQLGVQSSLFKTVLGALISAGTAEGQLAAIKVYSDPSNTVAGKGAILSALTTTQAPLSPAAVDFLSSTMKTESNGDLAKGASYALGASLKNSPEGAQKAEAIESLRQALVGNSNPLTDQLAALDAIGNSGQAAYLPELRSIILNPDSASVLRAKAVFALRFIRAPEATVLLAQSLSALDFQIRQAAARAMALATWSDSFRSPLQNCASSDPMSSIQSICRSVLDASDPKLASN